MERVLIWGTGKYCEKKYKSICELYEVVAFIDNNRNKIDYQHKDVVSYSQINEYKWDYIIILVYNFFEIIPYIRDMGVSPNKILLGANYKPYFGIERTYMADGRNRIEINEKFDIVYKGEDGASIIINSWDDLAYYFQTRKNEVIQYIRALPDLPVERAQGALIGKSIKRFYVDNYIYKNRRSIRGVVGEMEDRRYTELYGDTRRIRESYIIEHYVDFPENERFGLDMDLSTGEGVIAEKFDCFICTQTLTYIINLEKAIDSLIKMLKQGGILLITFPGMLHRASAQELDAYKPLYGILPSAIHKLLTPYLDNIEYSMEVYGNVKCAVATLYGIPSDVFTEEEMLKKDEDYPLLVGMKIKKTF